MHPSSVSSKVARIGLLPASHLPCEAERGELLSEGRETKGSLVDQIKKHENYIEDRLKWLRTYDMVSYYHEETGSYEITEKGEDLVSNTNYQLNKR